MMHFGFLIYSTYAIVGKIASKKEFLSKDFILAYGVVILILIFYAFIWQKVLKVFSLSTACSNKSVTIIWGIVFGKVIFSEQIKPTMVIGAVLILSGILYLNKQETEK
jgi:drug/metabolite transporter (DMT)-like permease